MKKKQHALFCINLQTNFKKVHHLNFLFYNGHILSIEHSSIAVNIYMVEVNHITD